MYDFDNPCAGRLIGDAGNERCNNPCTVATLPMPSGTPLGKDRRLCHTCAGRKEEQLFFIVYDNESEGTAAARHTALCERKHEQLRGRRFDSLAA